MNDEYAMNKETGEIIPATEAIHIFYGIENHGYMESWLDEWKLTGMPVADRFIESPEKVFAAAVNI